MNDRKGFIGASECSVLLGLNPFCTVLKLWSLKTGRLESSEQTEAQEWGHRLEKIVSAKFSEAHGVKLMAYKKRYVHPDMPYFSCELDNIIVGSNEIVEIKTVNAWDWKKWANPDELPSYIIVQVTAQMGLTGRSKAWVACLCGGQKYIEKEVNFDKGLWNTIEDAVKNFWTGFILTDIPPMASGEDNELLVKLHPTASEAMLEAIEDINNEVSRIQELKLHIKNMEDEKDEAEARVKAVIGDNLGIKTPEFTVKWPTQISKRVDNEKLKAEGLYEKYLKEILSRVLRISKNKET